MDIFEKFDNLITFADVLKSRPGGSCTSERDENWVGTPNFETADSLLRCGWDEGAKMIDEVKSLKVDACGVALRRRSAMSVVGGGVCVGAYLSGRPDCMVTKTKKEVRVNTCSIGYNIGVLGNVSAEEKIKNARKLVNAVMAIERAGVRVNLYMLKSADVYNMTMTLAIKIKDSGQPFNRLTMVYPLIHPSMHRRHGFNWMRSHPKSKGHSVGASIYDVGRVKSLCAAGGLHLDYCFTFDSLQRIKSVDDLVNLFKK